MGGVPALVSREARVLVIHEQPFVAEGMARRAERTAAVSCETCDSLDAALAAVRAELPDLIVCSDAVSPGVPLPAVTASLRGAGSGAPVLVVCRVHSVGAVDEALEAGASGYLPLVRAAEDIGPTVVAMLAGQAVVPDRDSLPHGARPRLTSREAEVLGGFSRGLSCKQVAFALGMAESTVKTHARSIFRKLDVCSRTAALHRARETGLL